MELIDAEDVAEFQRILRSNRLPRADFSLCATDTTDPTTDEVPGLQGEFTIRRKSTGQNKQCLINDSTSWFDLFRNDIKGGAFVAQDCLLVNCPASSSHKTSH
jgi:hypothetical protein